MDSFIPHTDPSMTDRPSAFCRGQSKRRWLSLAALWLCASAGLAGIIVVVERATAQAPPSLAITNVGGGQLKIVVTNASTGAQYELQRVTDLNDTIDPLFYWPTEAVGAAGQTNFTVEMGVFYQGFFRVVGCIDCDGDGIPNHQDGQPGNTNVGLLSITIDSPLNGVNIQ